MSKVFIEESTLTAIGNAIRNKTNKTDMLNPLDMASEIASITTGSSQTETTTMKRWDITVTSSLPSSGVYITLVTDTWLAENRANPNLCVLVLPKFTIPYSSSARNQGVFLGTNMSLMTDSSNVLYKSVSAYVHTNGAISVRARKYPLTGANDVGDIDITSGGALRAVAYSGYPFATGEYVVMAFIV